MANYAISNLCYRGVIGAIGTIIFGISLFVTVFGVYGVTNTKLRNLQYQEAMQSQNLKEADAKRVQEQQALAEKLKQLECLAKNVYWEAASEPYEGKIAVAQVTMNRLESGRYGKTVCQVVFQRSRVYEKVICQFSWTCSGQSRVPPRNQRLFRESEEVAKKVFFENYRLPHMTKAMYFHNTTVRPGWNKVRVAQIGQHIFYRD